MHDDIDIPLLVENLGSKNGSIHQVQVLNEGMGGGVNKKRKETRL